MESGMKESHRKGIANHPDPESCASHRKVAGEALDRGTGRQGVELRNHDFGGPTLSLQAEGETREGDKREPTRDPAQSETPGMPGNSMCENRETPLASGRNTPDRLEKATSYTASAHASGESDEPVVPAKRSNNEEQSWAKGVEGSGSAKGNTEETHTHRTQADSASGTMVRFDARTRGRSRMR